VLANSVVNPDKSTALLSTALPLNSTTSVGIVGITQGKERALINNIKVNGKNSLLGQSNNSVILGSQAAINYNVTVGDTFTVDNQQLKVIGVMQKQSIGSATSLDSTVFASLPFVQNISQSPGVVTADIITPNNGVYLQDARNTLQNSFNSSLYTVYTQQDALQVLNSNENASYVFLDLIIAMILIVSAILIMVVMMMSVKEKTKDIGTMRALGTSRMRIMLLIIYESLIISCIGGIIGLILIIPLYNLFLLLAGSTSFSYTIPLSIVLEIAVVVIVIGTFSGLIPAYQATRISPIEALRYE
jgi:putative ABC transport system permease protein